MKTAIIILNWNGKELLKKFLPSIVQFSIEQADIYVADNASTDDSISFIKEIYPSIKIIQNKENGGYAKGYNDALKHVKADIYCLINSDVEVSENWLTPIIEEFKKNKTTGVLQPKILDYKAKDKFEYAGACGGYLDFLAYPYCKGRVFNTIEKDKNQFDIKSEIFWASGACFFVRSKIFEEMNGFDEDYFAHQEEIDFCWRVKNSGYKIKFIPESRVFHVGAATLSNYNPKKTFLNFRNSLFSIVKNIPKKYFLFILFSRLVLDGIAAAKFFIELKPIHSFAILKAHLSFYSKFLKFLNKRKHLNQEIKYYSHRSIVFQYFILGRKEYRKLR